MEPLAVARHLVRGGLLAAALLGACAGAGTAAADAPARRLNPRLLALPPNTWTVLSESTAYRRQAHAGVAYDSRRGTLLVFGSNTHGLDWNDAVHEFDPVTARWSIHYPAAPQESYRADAAGRAIAGSGRLQPWAMHTYDTLVYDPLLDAVVVSAVPEHNPIRKSVPEAKVHPTWIYDLATRQWRIFENGGERYPKFFAGAAAYDPDRKVIAAYRFGMWEIGPARDRWQKASREQHHKMHYNMEYDARHRQFVVFGDYNNSSEVWTYAPGPRAGEPGQWTRRTPEGDSCPAGQHYPVAWDREHGVFLLVVDDIPFTLDRKGRRKPAGRARSSHTFVYDPGRNRCTRLPGADLAPLGMNYMMVYDAFHRAFLLVTGDANGPVTVRALKLGWPLRAPG
jgi:hypothetical protein